MIQSDYQIVDNGDAAITIIFSQPISEALSVKIMQLAQQLKQTLANQLENIIPGYQSLTLSYKITTLSRKSLTQTITKLLQGTLPALNYKPKLVTIPVCYEQQYAPDLNALATHCGLSKEAVIQAHSREIYIVHMLGFLPGFLYLGGLNPQLNCPRKTTPASNVAAGSVAIGGSQTGVYPVSSPGGWHIIGRTPLALFKPETKQPFIAAALDKIQFVAISSSQFQILLP